MKFKVFYAGSLDESKKNMKSYQKAYSKYWEKFKNMYSDDREIVDNIFKKMMEDGWTKQEIHMYK